jgi:hypothetical protein
MPILTYDSLDAVPEGLREVAKTEGDKVTVNVVPQAKLEEFRDKNIELLKERDALKGQVDTLAPLVGEDVEAFNTELTELRATAQRVKDGQLTEGRKVEEEILRRTDDMRKTLEEQVRGAQKETGAWKTRAEQLDGTLKRTLVTSTIKDAAIDPEAGVLPGAIGDILRRAHDVWRAGDDGKVLAYQGDLQLYGADGGSPLTPKEWIAKLKEETPHYFKGTQGGGATGGTETRGAHGKTAQEVKALSASERLALANGDKGAKL